MYQAPITIKPQRRLCALRFRSRTRGKNNTVTVGIRKEGSNVKGNFTRRIPSYQRKGQFRSLLPQKSSKSIHADIAISWSIFEEIVQPGQKEPHHRRRIICALTADNRGIAAKLCSNALCKYVMSLAINQSFV